MGDGELLETYRDHGLDVVPVQPSSKVPMYKQWQSNTALVGDFEDGCNIAVHCGASQGHIVVVDCDQRAASKLSRLLLPTIREKRIGGSITILSIGMTTQKFRGISIYCCNGWPVIGQYLA